MADENRVSTGWKNFRPSKTLWIWSCRGTAVAVMIVGFTAGGWVTGGTADEMAETAAEDARTELVASVCVERVMNSPDAATTLAELKEAESWNRDELISDGGWATLAGIDEPVYGSADLCAETLAEMDAPAKTARSTDKVGG